MQDSDNPSHDNRRSGVGRPGEDAFSGLPDAGGWRFDAAFASDMLNPHIADDHAFTGMRSMPAAPAPSVPAVPTPAPTPADEGTQPPVSTLRRATPWLLFRDIPEICDLIMQRPSEDEDNLGFLIRLRASTTPEEAVTYTAFAIRPEQAAGWGYECLRAMADHLNPMERPMMEMIATWLAHPGTAMRHRVMREALYAASRSPSVLLGLAVGWSSGGPAPNDDLPAPLWRMPQALNSAILSCLSRATLSRRPIYLARFIDMAESLFREY